MLHKCKQKNRFRESEHPSHPLRLKEISSPNLPLSHSSLGQPRKVSQNDNETGLLGYSWGKFIDLSEFVSKVAAATLVSGGSPGPLSTTNWIYVDRVAVFQTLCIYQLNDSEIGVYTAWR